MLFNRLLLLSVAGGLAGLVTAQFPPKPEGVTVLESKLEEGVTISYKEVKNLSRTVITFCLHDTRMTSARRLMACEAILAMSICPLELLRTWACKTRPTKSTHFSGSSSQGKTPQMHRSQYG
jgi:hypothetical protein